MGRIKLDKTQREQLAGMIERGVRSSVIAIHFKVTRQYVNKLRKIESMATEDAKFVSPVLTKDKSAVRANLKPGEPWTFLTGTLDMANVKEGGFISAWWDTSEPGRLFRVVKIHPTGVETTFERFENVNHLANREKGDE